MILFRITKQFHLKIMVYVYVQVIQLRLVLLNLEIFFMLFKHMGVNAPYLHVQLVPFAK